MSQRLNEEINRIKKLMTESDIAGIDELVYNPLTGPGKEIGHGYDRGKRVQGITWGGHDDHLHIGFTNRDVAMKVIDKADSLGLKTTENPYAKRDPNGKVDKVHTSGSFHYKTFEGTPLVGAGVDISGNKSAIKELIIWIEQNFADKNLPSTETQDFSSDGGLDLELNDLTNILSGEIGGKSIKNLAGITDSDLEPSFLETLSKFVKNWGGILKI